MVQTQRQTKNRMPSATNRNNKGSSFLRYTANMLTHTHRLVTPICTC